MRSLEDIGGLRFQNASIACGNEKRTETKMETKRDLLLFTIGKVETSRKRKTRKHGNEGGKKQGLRFHWFPRFQSIGGLDHARNL